MPQMVKYYCEWSILIDTVCIYRNITKENSLCKHNPERNYAITDKRKKNTALFIISIFFVVLLSNVDNFYYDIDSWLHLLIMQPS